MRRSRPGEMVDLVIIGSGAAAGIMAKPLSAAGFSASMLEEGGRGRNGRAHEYTKDGLLHRNHTWQDRMMSDPPAGSRTPSAGRTRTMRSRKHTPAGALPAAGSSPIWTQLAPACRGYSVRPATSGRSRAPGSPTGRPSARSSSRTMCTTSERWTSPGLAWNLSLSRRRSRITPSPQIIGIPVRGCGREARPRGRARSAGDHRRAQHGPAGAFQLPDPGAELRAGDLRRLQGTRDPTDIAHDRGGGPIVDDPSTPVPDRYRRAHDVPHLFLVAGNMADGTIRQ